MKRSIPNIISSLFFIFIVPPWVYMCWELVNKIITSNSIDFFKIAILLFGVMVIFALGFWLIFKFKFVKIDDKGIYAFYPFLNKRKQILWKDLHNITADVIDTPQNKLPAHRQIIIKGKKGRERIVEISLTDREFENFNTLTNAIPIPKARILRAKIDIKQAKDEKYVLLMYTAASGIGVLWLLYILLFDEIKLLIIVLGSR